MLEKVLKQLFLGKKAYALIILGSIAWSLIMVKSGLVYPFGMGFWGPNGHDGVWHIALIESLAKGSWEMPTFAGETLKNYHVGFDLGVAFVQKITGIPVVNLYFQIIPPILALLVGILTYKFVYRWRGSKIESFWATFFVYFGGSFGWIVTLLRDGEIGGESMFWSQQAISTLINPPFALSLVLILLGMIFLLKLQDRFKVYDLGFTILFFGTLIQIKAYAGILVLGALFAAGIYSLIVNRKSHIILVFLGSLFLSLLLFIPLNKNSSSLLVFKPFWFLETMMQLSDRVGWTKFGEAMVNWRLAGNWIKATPAYLVAFLIFWFGNLGTRVIKEILVWRWIKNFKSISFLDVFFASIVTAGVAIPMFFLQKGTPWNTIQFMYYSLFFSGILAGIVLGEWSEKSNVTLLYNAVTATVVLLTIPTTFGTLRHYLPQRPPAMISNAELEALEFLSHQANGVVLTFPFDRVKAKLAEANPPRPLYLYESTAYVSAFSTQKVFLEDEVNLDITGYDWKERKDEAEKFYVTLDQAEARGFLKRNDISYVYWVAGQRARLGEGQLGLVRIFENSEVDIYKVE